MRPSRSVRPSRRLALLPLVAAALAACGGGDATDPAPRPTSPHVADVFTPGNVFSPFTTTIAVGDTVRFNIAGAQHNVKFDRTGAGASAPADIPVVGNTVVSRRFDVKGTFPYDCTVHPGMSGQIVVQ